VDPRPAARALPRPRRRRPARLRPGLAGTAPRRHARRAYAAAVSTFDWQDFHDRLAGGLFLQELREHLRERYDFVLVDSRTGWSDTAGVCTVVLPDTVVACFNLSIQAIEGAAEAARSIQENAVRRPIRLLPAPLGVEDGEQLKLEAGRDHARALFAPFLPAWPPDEADRYWGDMEIPYKPYYAYEELPATVGDRPHQENSLLAAYLRMAARITGAPVVPARLAEPERDALLAAYARPSFVLPSAAVLSHAPRDRAWAEWIAVELRALGFRPELRSTGAEPDDPASRLDPGNPVGPGGPGVPGVPVGPVGPVGPAAEREPEPPLLLVLYGAAYPPADEAPAEVRAAPPGRRVAVRIGDLPLPGWLAGGPVIDLAGAGAEDARAALLAAMGRPRRPVPPEADGGRRAAEVRERVRFPGSVPVLWNAPARNPGFTGREALLDAVRTTLAGRSDPGSHLPLVLRGLGGVGKTQLALEYAHRFRADYDVVWWISATEPALVSQQLAELGPGLGLPYDADIAGVSAAVREALRRGLPYQRWLLVLDNADDPERLAPLLPSGGTGHILVTSRNRNWDLRAYTLEVDVFTRRESVRLLCAGRPGLSPADADRIACELGDLPLALGHAAAWLQHTGLGADVYLSLLDSQIAEMAVRDPVTAEPRPVAAAWLLSWNRIAAEMPAAGELLRLLAFLGPEPVPIWLVASDRMRRLLLPLDPRLREPGMEGRLLGEISKYAGVRLDPAEGTLTMHRLVQAVLREQATPADRQALRAAAHSVLAAANPGDPDAPRTWPDYSALLPHLGPTRAARSEDPEVRQWIADSVRYLWRRGDHQAVQQTAETVLAVWTPRHGPDDRLVLRVRGQLANVLRAQGDLAGARAMDEDVHRRSVRTLGRDHLDTLVAAGSLGADLRAGGRYVRAREVDRDAFETSRQVFGEQHARTLMLANNLALSCFLCGDRAAAREMDRETRQRMAAALGPEHPSTLLAAHNYARDLLETGQVADAVRLLQESRGPLRERLGDSHDTTMLHARTLAAALRRAGRYESAAALAGETLRHYTERHGPHHPEALGCASVLASVLGMLGEERREQARVLAERTAERCREAVGAEHPLTLGCLVGLALQQRRCGEPERARDLTGAVLPVLRREFGEGHPLTLACAVNHAADLAESGSALEAARLGAETLRSYRAQARRGLGETHPDAVVCAVNLALDLEAAGGDPAAARERRRSAAALAARVFGAGHPLVAEALAGRRLPVVIDPPTV